MFYILILIYIIAYSQQYKFYKQKVNNYIMIFDHENNEYGGGHTSNPVFIPFSFNCKLTSKAFLSPFLE